MKKERLDILIDLYEYAEEQGTIHFSFSVDNEWIELKGLDFEYLEDAGYVKSEDIIPYLEYGITITHKGMDIVEQHRINMGFYNKLNLIK